MIDDELTGITTHAQAEQALAELWHDVATVPMIRRAHEIINTS